MDTEAEAVGPELRSPGILFQERSCTGLSVARPNSGPTQDSVLPTQHHLQAGGGIAGPGTAFWADSSSRDPWEWTCVFLKQAGTSGVSFYHHHTMARLPHWGL